MSTQDLRSIMSSKRFLSSTVTAAALVVFAFRGNNQMTAKASQSYFRKLLESMDSPIDLGIDEDQIPEELRANIPTVGEVNDLYGPEPVVLGMDRCEAFRAEFAPEDRFMSIAGLYNTGTNFLFDTLSNNCILPEREKSFEKHQHHGEIERGILSGVHWGKHSPISLRETHVLPKYEGLIDFARFNSMPVAVVKDPVFWMASMCRRWYDVTSIEGDSAQYGRCPYLAADESGTPIPVSGSLNPYHESFTYRSLVDLWNQFYLDYEQFSGPRLIVRYEDLIFHGDEVVRQICSCAGGEVKEFSPEEESTKAKVEDKNGAHGLVQSATIYGSKSERSTIFKSEADRAFAEMNLDEGLMSKLSYQIPRDILNEEPGDEAEIEDLDDLFEAVNEIIPHIMWFIPQQNVLTELYFKSVVATIDAYKEMWGEPDAEVRILSDEKCAILIEEVVPDLSVSFETDGDQMRKSDLCKAAALYKYGGYYFATDVETVEPFIPSEDSDFVGTFNCVGNDCLLSSTFLASAPEHPLLKVALDGFADSYKEDALSASMVVRKKVAEAYENQLSTSRGLQVLDEIDLDSIEGEGSYPEVNRQQGRGDCNVVVRDPKKPGLILFFSHFLGSEKCQDVGAQK